MLGDLNKWDLVGKIMPLLERGYYVRPEDGKITHGQAGVIPNLPWVFISYMQDAVCKYYHEVCLGCFNFIHSRCLNCWKIVCRPKTVADLFNMLELMKKELPDIDSKLGIEERGYVHGNYGCYWYTRSKDEGLETHERIRKAIANSPKLRHLLKAKDSEGRLKNLILKRACTEYEMRFGDSSKWKQSEDDRYWEKTLEEVFVMPMTTAPQPDYVKHHIFLKWLKFAYERGDSTALQFNNGELFYPDYVKYHRGMK